MRRLVCALWRRKLVSGGGRRRHGSSRAPATADKSAPPQSSDKSEQSKAGASEQQREGGWLGDIGGLALRLGGEIGVVHRVGLRAGCGARCAEPDEAQFEGVGEGGTVAQGQCVVEAAGVQREVRLRDEQIEIRVDEWRRALQQFVEIEVEEDREACPAVSVRPLTW